MRNFRFKQFVHLPEMLDFGQRLLNVLERPVIRRDAERTSSFRGYFLVHDHLHQSLPARIDQVGVIERSCRRSTNEGED